MHMEKVNVTLPMDADLKKSMEEVCSKMGMSLTAAFTIFAEKLSDEKKFPFDPFYCRSNMRYLEGIVRDIEEGRAHFAEHELIEVED